MELKKHKKILYQVELLQQTLLDVTCNAVGREAIEGLRFLASLPCAGTRREKTQPFNWIHSRLFMLGNGKFAFKCMNQYSKEECIMYLQY